MGKVATSPLPPRGSPPLQSGGGKSEVAHKWAKWLRHPCRLGDPHRFRAGGGNQKWPTNGQSGYVTPAVSGIPTAAERGGKSKVAHLWAKWLRHPCRLGDPHRCIAGGEIRSGPLVGKGVTSPLPSRGSPPLQSGGGKSEVAHLWAKWLRHPCRLGDPVRFTAWQEIRSGPQVGKVATSPLPPRGSPPLQSGGGNQKWPTSGQSGYVTPAVSGIPTAAERGGGESEVAHKWAKWLRHPCRLGDPHRCRAGGEIRSGPLVGKVATSPLPSRGSPPLQSGGKIRSGPLVGKVATSPLPSQGSPPLQSGGRNQKWPTYGQSGYVTPAVSGIPTAAERGKNQKWPTCGQSGYVTPAVSGDPHRCKAGGKSEVAHLCAKGLRHPCRLGDPHRFRAGENQKWPNCGQSGYVTPAVSGIPTAAERGGGGGDEKWPTCGQSGYVTPVVSGTPTASQRGKNQKWPTCGQSGYVTPAVSGIPTAAERGWKSQVAHLWAKWLRHPCRLGDPHCCRAGGEIKSGPQVGKVATSPLPSRGSPPLQSGG